MNFNAGTKKQIIKQLMFSYVKIQDNRNKNDSKNIVFYACIFQSHLGGFGRGLGRVLGGVWSLSGVCWTTFGLIFGCLYFEWSPKGAWEASDGFSLHLERFGRGPGRILECFGRSLVPKRTPGSIWA